MKITAENTDTKENEIILRCKTYDTKNLNDGLKKFQNKL
ncbi:hypothetical protein JOC62_000424 [Clostridium sardiniense]|nr:hypothetical protein [Clostridium sardiniense]